MPIGEGPVFAGATAPPWLRPAYRPDPACMLLCNRAHQVWISSLCSLAFWNVAMKQVMLSISEVFMEGMQTCRI